MASKSKRIALGGVMAALCILVLYMASYLPTSRLFFYGVSSVFCAVMVIEAGVKWAWIFYGATMLLSIAIIPDKVRVVPYVAFFGMYGIIKYYIEGLKNTAVEIVLKGLFFAICSGVSLYIFGELFMGNIKSSLPVGALAVAAIVVFYIYDYVYTLFVIYYEKRIKNRIK